MNNFELPELNIVTLAAGDAVKVSGMGGENELPIAP